MSSVPRWLLPGWLALAALVTTRLAPAQVAPESLQRAWLREVLDVDPAAAAASYQRIVESRSSAPTDRWVASARLLELQSLGLAPEAMVQPTDLPPRLQERILEDAAEQVTRDRLRSQADRAPEQLPTAIRNDRRTTLRPFVFLSTVLALEELRPGDPLLWRRLQIERRRNAERPRTTSRTMQVVYAPVILRAELAGQSQRADALRTLAFAEWRPPALPADKAAALRNVRVNLEQWSRERQLTGTQQEALRSLSAALDAAAARSPDEALQLLQRLPVYAERLLGAAATTGPVEPATGQGR